MSHPGLRGQIGSPARAIDEGLRHVGSRVLDDPGTAVEDVPSIPADDLRCWTRSGETRQHLGCPWPWQSPHWWPREVPAGGQVEVPTLCSCRP